MEAFDGVKTQHLTATNAPNSQHLTAIH